MTRIPEHIKFAKNLIKEATETKAKTLDLGFCGLTDLEKEIPELFELVCLEQLVLGNRFTDDNQWFEKRNFDIENDFQKIPRSIKKLKNLKKLILSNLYLDASAVLQLSLLNLNQLTTLIIAENYIGDQGAAAISKMTNLTLLDVGFNEIGDQGATAISSMTNLISLDLGFNQIRNNGAIAISKMPNLTSLVLTKNQIGDNGAAAIFRITTLDSLRLGSNQIGDNGVRDISYLAQLKSLDLSRNLIGNKGINAIANLTALTLLDVSSNLIGESGATALAGLKNLNYLNIGSNQIGDEGVITIAKLKNLTWLDIGSNHIGDKGVTLVSSLTKLTSLDVRWNNIGLKGAIAISKMLKLTWLDISSNEIGDQGAAAISKMKNLISLNLGHNQIGDQGAAELSKMLNLIELGLNYNNIGLLSYLKPLKHLKILTALDNPARDTPAAILSVGNCLQNLQAWWDVTKNPKYTTPNQWVNVQISGNGTVGKSTLVEAIEHGYCNQELESTDGVWMKQLMILNNDRTPIQLTIWDFGGQEIYHHTHRIFLSDNSIHLLVYDYDNESAALASKKVLDPTSGIEVENQTINYWLETFLQDKKECKTIIIENKLDAFREVGKELRKKQEQLGLTHFSVSAHTGENIGILKDAIKVAAKEFRHFGMIMPKSWINVRQHFISNLEMNKDSLKIMSNDEFFTLCEEHDVSKASVPSLLNYLHDCGLVYVHEDMGSNIITDLRWALDAIYKPLSRSGSFYAHLLDRYGRVAAREVFEAFGENYPLGQCWLFINFMESCGICFPHKSIGFKEYGLDTIYIFPAFLQEEPSQFIRHIWESFNKGTDEVKTYTVKEFPISRVYAFLTEMGNKTDNRLIWKNGLVIHKSGEAVWIEFIGKEKVKMTVRKDFIQSSISREMYLRINKHFRIINAQGHIRSTIHSNLQKVDRQKVSPLKDQPQTKFPELVISYAKEDEQFLEELRKSLSAYKSDYGLIISYDKKITNGIDDWSEVVEAAFNRADGFIIIATKEYADAEKKKYIHEVEIPLMIKRRVPKYLIKAKAVKLQKYLSKQPNWFEKGDVCPADDYGRDAFLEDFGRKMIEGKFLPWFKQKYLKD